MFRFATKLARQTISKSPKRRTVRPTLESLEKREVLSSLPYDFPYTLEHEIAYLKTKSQPENYAEKKVILLEKALNSYKDHQVNYQLGVVLDQAAGNYVLKQGVLPAYFNTPYQNDDATKITTRTEYYDYNGSKAGARNVYWVDFANVNLGGAVFGAGFVQEEQMFLEIPELANLVEYGYGHPSAEIKTRTPNDASQPDSVQGPLGGSPTPWIFHDAQVTMMIDAQDKALYNKKLDQISTQDIKAHSQAIDPIAANILAIAAPRLADKSDAKRLDVIDDLFNSFVAAFSFAKNDASVAHPLINSGKIGAGVFNNDPDVVFVLQDLAARYLGVNLQLWDYASDTTATLEAEYVQPILSYYQRDASINPALNKVSHLLTIAHEVLNGQTPPIPTPPVPPVPTPAVVGESTTLVYTQHNRQGKPVGKPFVGLTFNFNTPLDHSKLSNSGNYRVSYATITKARGKVVTKYTPVNVFSISIGAGDNSVSVVVRANPTKFPKGGRIVINGSGPGSLTNTAGVDFGHDLTFNISPKGRSVTPG